VEVWACKKYVLLRGVVSLTPLRTTKNIRTIEPAMRIRDAKPKPAPMEQLSALLAIAQIEDGTHEDQALRGLVLFLRERWVFEERMQFDRTAKGAVDRGLVSFLHTRSRRGRDKGIVDTKRGRRAVGGQFGSSDLRPTTWRIKMTYRTDFGVVALIM